MPEEQKPRSRLRGKPSPLPAPQEKASAPSPKEKGPGLFGSILELCRIVFLLFILSSAASWFVTGNSVFWGWRGAQWARGVQGVQVWWNGPRQFTPDELARHNGEDESKPIYVGLNGTVYDVSAAASTYGPGGPYHFFAGRDAARAFVTGCFQDDLTDDLRGVEDMLIPHYAVVPDGSAAAEDARSAWARRQEKKTKEKSKSGAGAGGERHGHKQQQARGGQKRPVESAGAVDDVLYADEIDGERDRRIALGNVADTIRHWGSLLAGRTGDRPYFEVGTIVYSEEESRQRANRPPPSLCQPALESRPTVTVIARSRGSD